jgi:phage shock protein A
MKLIRKVKIALRSAVHDLIGEDEFTPEGEEAALLSAGQKRLEQLRQKIAPATAREKRAQLEQRRALAESQALNKAADDALIAGRDDLAAEKLRQAKLAEARAAEAGERHKHYDQATAALRAEISQLEANLENLRRHYSTLPDREASVETVEHVQTLRREQRTDSRALRDDLEARKERLARREDHAAAREEVDKSGLPDE